MWAGELVCFSRVLPCPLAQAPPWLTTTGREHRGQEERGARAGKGGRTRDRACLWPRYFCTRTVGDSSRSHSCTCVSRLPRQAVCRGVCSRVCGLVCVQAMSVCRISLCAGYVWPQSAGTRSVCTQCVARLPPGLSPPSPTLSPTDPVPRGQLWQ